MEPFNNFSLFLIDNNAELLKLSRLMNLYLIKIIITILN